MKKLLIFTFLMASMVFIVPASDVKSNAESNFSTELQQRRGQIYQRQRDNRRYNRYRRGARTVYRSTYVRSGYRLYRYTYRVTYLPNGRVIRRLVSRTRVR